MRRYAHKLGGSGSKEKFASRQEKEEREFLEAWQREREAEEHKDSLTNALQNAEGERLTQEAVKKRHDEAQVLLDQMYDSIFSGPTPDVPGEDQVEQAVKNARSWFQQCEIKVRNENHALEQLSKAKSFLKQALDNMQSARNRSNADRFGGGGM